MKKHIYLIFISALLFSCGGKSNKLQFSEFEIKDRDGGTGIAVNNSGSVTINDKVIGEISKDGIFNDRNGKLIAKLTSDGVLEDKSGDSLVKVECL